MKDSWIARTRLLGRRSARLAAAAALAVALLPFVVLTTPDRALAGPAPVFTMYVPFADDDAHAGLEGIAGTGPTYEDAVTTIDITSAADDSVIYWDHWEDGYEVDLANPVQPTTEIWGDNDGSNGTTPGAATDDVDAGTVIFLQNTVPLPRSVSDPPLAGEIFFDGRDKIASTRGFAMTRAMWDSNIGTVHAGAVAGTDLSKWGASFDFPVGENMGIEAFDYTALGMTASDDDTVVSIDVDGDGSVDRTASLDEGETVFVDGGIASGGSAEATKPMQAHLITGERDSRWEGRWFELYPEEIRGDSYVAAAGGTSADQLITLFVHNPNDRAITVAVDAAGTADDTNLALDPGEVAPYNLPNGSGAELSSPGNPFIAVSATVALQTWTENYDWGYSLVPTSSLTPGVVVGWGQGNPSGDDIHSPVWVAPLDNVTSTGIRIYADFDGDGVADQVDTDYDEVGDAPYFTANAFDSVRVTDHNDRDMTGARIYTADGTLISTAWGQDVAEGECCDAFDLGSAVLPSTSLVTTKTARLAVDLNSDGVVNPGDTIEYTIRSVDAGALALTNLQFIDTLPTTLTYVPATTFLDGAPVPDDTVGSTAFPVDEAGLALSVLAPGAATEVTFQATVVNPFPPFIQNVRNDVSVTADQANSTATAITPVQIPDLYLVKTAPGGPVLPGERFEYTLDVSNVSVSPQTGIDVTDPLPPEVDWVSTTVTRPIDDPAPGGSDTILETWGTPAYTNDPASWLTDWIETDADGGGAASGDVRIVSELGSNRLTLDDGGSEIGRTFDATDWDKAIISFDWRRDDFEADDEVRFEVSTTNGSTWRTLDVFSGPATDVRYLTTTYDLTRYVGHPIMLRFVTGPTMDDSDDFFVDNVQIDLDQRIMETVAGRRPPSVYLSGELLTGENLSITVEVDVIDPIDPSIDSFDNTAQAVSAQNLSPVTATATVDVARASVGDTVWHDVDGDGTIDGGEGVIAGVIVELRDATNAVVGTDVTDPSGRYRFSELDPGDYTVAVVGGVPAGMRPTDDADGGQDATTAVSLTFGEDEDGIDFGYATPVTIGDRVFADLDADGVENGVDFGIDGIDLTLTGTSPNASHPGGTTTTTTAGTYTFGDLLPGTYTVTVDTGPLSAASYATTTANAQVGDTQTITVTSGSDEASGDFGYVLPAAIGDLVWHDLDADGVRDAGEPPLGGVTVTATGPGLPAGGVVRTTTADGYYLFANLDAGTFDVTVSPGTGALPAGWDSSTGGVSQSVTIGSTEIADDADFGFYTQGSIGDLVFEDVNGNGSYDPGTDQPLDGLTVTITGTSPGASHPGGADQTTVGGAYDFTGLEPGTYTVVVVDDAFPAGTVVTLDGTAPSVTIRSTDDRDDVDVGYLFPASIGDVVWHDLDADGVADVGEAGLAGAELTLTGGSLPPAGVTTTTDAGGAYAFSNLTPGTYTVSLSSLPTGYTASTVTSFVVTVDSDDVVDTADFGAFTTADVGDLVWHDLDGDGVVDAGEPPLDGVTMTLSQGAATVATVDTGSGGLAPGEYRFDDLDPGTYTVTVDTADLPAGYATTTGGDTRTITLVSDGDRLDLDFGYATTATIGDLVYDDLDGDGIRDAGEPGIDGVTVRLVQGATTLATTVTSGGGGYDFTSVAPGVYDLSIDPADLVAGATVTEGAGGYGSVTVASGDDLDTVDFGVANPASVGDRLWHDLDGDGAQDPGESDGFGGVTVTLSGPGLPVGGLTDVTDAAGGYGFSGLLPGTYTVTVTGADLPAGAVSTSGGAARSVTLTSGETDGTVDFGYRLPASVGDLVWHDLDGDGVRDGGEPGIASVTITVDDGVTTTTTDTDAAGAYDVTGLAPDSYTVSLDTADLAAGAASTTGGFASGPVTVVSGDDIDTIDFGVRYPASIGDLVFTDLDGDGAHDPGEPGLGDITVTITGTSAGASHPGGTTTVTTSVGAYGFGGLLPGTYDVTVDAADTDLPTAAVASGPVTRTITVVSGADVDTADFGFVEPASIGDRVFDDANADGDDEAGADAGLAGVTLELRRGVTVVGSVTTTSTGAYDFTGLAPGTYDVVVTDVPAGYVNTLGGSAQTFTLASGDDEDDADFGYFLGASIGDFVFEDLDGDGVVDAGEPGYDGVTVTITGGDLPPAGLEQDTVDGAYDVTGLTPGTYTVAVDTGDLPPGTTNTLGGTSRTLVVASGDDVDLADFGYIEPATIGDLVWEDVDGDGVRDAGEPGIGGVTVSIAGIAADVTAADGSYSLTGLVPGTYDVVVDTGDLPAGALPTTAGFTRTVTLRSGDTVDTADFGVAAPASIGDTVWLDLDGDGTLDTGESGVAGVVVRLEGPGLPAAGITDVTDAAGVYGFGGLRPGTYDVTTTAGLPAGVVSTTGGTTRTPTIVSGEALDTVDFGVAALASIGDRVWDDLDGDGTQNDGATGIAGVEVTVTGTSPGASHPGGTTATTGADGAYAVTGLMPGTYTVALDPGGLPGGRSWSSSTGGRSRTVTVASGDALETVDFGEVAAASIGDLVWHDVDGDGVRDGGEPGIAGVVVELRDPTDAVIATDTTDAAGGYGFGGLPPGDHEVTIDPTTIPTGLVSGAAFAPTTAESVALTLSSGDVVDTVDIGYATTGTVEGTVFEDDDASGSLDGSEQGIPAIDVELVDGGGSVVQRVTTAGDGTYSFPAVAPGGYTVRPVAGTVPAGFGATTATTIPITVGSDELVTDIDVGYARPASIGDLVWHDLDADGVVDVGVEPGLAGVDVELVDGGGGVLRTLTTGGDGRYDFDGLTPGSYTVRVDVSTLPVGATSGVAFTSSAGLPVSRSVVVASGDVVDTADFGFGTTAVIGDLVWHDLDADGVVDGGEPPMVAVDVELLDPTATVVTTATTDAAGAYRFDGVAPGTYTVRLDRTSLPPSYSSTTGNDPTVVTVGSDEARLDVDFGEAQLTGGLVGDRIWDDLDGDGVSDPGEPGIDGVDVELVRSGAVIDTRTTTGGGGYTFANLAPGSYTVRVVQSSTPTGFAPSAGGWTRTTTLLSGGVDRDLDIGLVAPASIGDLVWHDLDGDGVADAGEPPLAGVVVEIRSGGSVVATATTDGAGAYSVDVAPGTYDVVLDATSAPVGSNSAAPLTVTTAPITGLVLVSNGRVDTADIGLATTARIGDTIFDDLDGDGLQDADEPGLAGVDVRLDDGRGGVATVTTGADGRYEFVGVVPGSYSVTVDTTTLPTGAVATTTASPVPVTVGSDDRVDDVDLGFALPGSIAGVLWTDVDGDGLDDGVDTGEVRRPGIAVELLDASGAVVATTTTDGSGGYSFQALVPGDYAVRPIVPTGERLTVHDAGDDDRLDSDVVPATGRTTLIGIRSGDVVADVDAGLFVPATIGDTVFADLDGDGLQGADEPGIGGVTVTVRDAADVVVATVVTAADGTYLATVAPGDHRVVATPPDGWLVAAGFESITASVASGESVDDADVPLLPNRRLAGAVVYDVAGDSTSDPSDPGLGGLDVTATWVGPDGPVIFTTTTGPDGTYVFPSLPPGDYTVTVDETDLPDGIVVPTIDPDGATGGVDLETTVDLTGGDQTTIVFGVTGAARLGDQVFVDSDGDGIADPGEPGVGGVTVIAVVTTSVGEMTRTTVTDGDGRYEFTGLPAGDYVVSIDPATVPDGMVPTGGDRSTTLVIGGVDDTVDLPVVPTDGPVAVDDWASTPPATPVIVDVVDNDILQPGTAVTVVGHTDPSDGGVVLLPDGTISYTPDIGFEGTDTFEYTICDLDALERFGDTPEMREVFCSTATVTVVTPPPPPTADDSVDPPPDPPDSPGTPVTTAPPPPPAAPDLPRTGTDAFPIPLVGGSLVAVGLALWVLTRRRPPEVVPLPVRSRDRAHHWPPPTPPATPTRDRPHRWPPPPGARPRA